MIKVFYIILTFSFLLFFIGCKEKLPVISQLSKNTYFLINQDESLVQFPQKYNGKIVVIGYIFTRCPDICPMTTHNMYLIEKELSEELIDDVLFINLSFDPHIDSPSVLKDYGRIRGLDFNRWEFLTGTEEVISSLLKKVDVYAIVDTTYYDDGRMDYYYIHTDRISLIDRDGNVRKDYSGSTINIQEIINDIKTLR